MVADLVGDDIGLGEAAGRAEAARQLVEEAEVEVDLAVGRTIERAHGRLALAAPRRMVLVVEHERRRPVGRPVLAEHLAPGVLGIGQDRAAELRILVVGAGPLRALGLDDARLGRGRLETAVAAALQQAARVDPEQEGEPDQDDGPEATTADHQRPAAAEPAALAAVVLDIVRKPFVFPAHVTLWLALIKRKPQPMAPEPARKS